MSITKNKKNATAVTPASTEIISIWTITNIATKIEQASIGIITAIRVATTISAQLLGFILPDKLTVNHIKYKKCQQTFCADAHICFIAAINLTYLLP